MPVITYTAVDRGFIASGHSATQQYQLENAFRAFPITHKRRGRYRETLDGTPEAYVYALERTWRIETDLIYAVNVALWEEFFSSVLGCETFAVDFTGTVLSPGTDVDVFLVDGSISRQQLRGNNAAYQFTVRALP